MWNKQYSTVTLQTFRIFEPISIHLIGIGTMWLITTVTYYSDQVRVGVLWLLEDMNPNIYSLMKELTRPDKKGRPNPIPFLF
jgi:hypothetical protein